jgi:hypothetical protein
MIIFIAEKLSTTSLGFLPGFFAIPYYVYVCMGESRLVEFYNVGLNGTGMHLLGVSSFE